MNKNKLNIRNKMKFSGVGRFSFKGSTSKFFENHITKSIRGYLEPYTEKKNFNFLKRVGFKDFITVFKHYSFQGFLAIN